MLDNLNVEFEEMDMEELQEEVDGGLACVCDGAAYLVVRPKRP